MGNLVMGVGIYDIPGDASSSNRHKAFARWKALLQRCYNDKFQKDHHTYIGCTVCEDWLRYSNFKLWLTSQDDWETLEIDKDILDPKNKIYSPEKCILIASKVNSFVTDAAKNRGANPIGVCWNKRDEKFQGTINNPFTGRKNSVGYFECPDEAHKAWKSKKREFCFMFKESGLIDDNILDCLLYRFS